MEYINYCTNQIFNSHPHKEDDFASTEPFANIRFSTHILTRRMTVPLPTLFGVYKFFNSHPHKEDDIFHLHKCTGIFFFNSHPHKEDDAFCDAMVAHGYFSTHILTRRMTSGDPSAGTVEAFQLTSSQGG